MKIKPKDLIDVLLDEEPTFQKVKKKKITDEDELSPPAKKSKKKGNKNERVNK